MIDQKPIVDSREPETIRQSLIQQGWLQKPLQSGDYSFLAHDGLKIGITRKASEDLLNSIGEVFAKQLDEMLDFYDICFFLREGPLQRDPSTDSLHSSQGVSRHTYSGVENWLIRFYNKGFSPMISANVQHTCQRLCELYAFYQKPYSLSSRSRKHTDDRVLALCSGLRGKTGQNALEDRSIADLCAMDVNQLEQLPGFGHKKAQSLYNHLHRKHKEVSNASEERSAGELQEHPILRC